MSVDKVEAARRLIALDAALEEIPEAERGAQYARQLTERWPLVTALLEAHSGHERRSATRVPAPMTVDVRGKDGAPTAYQAVDVSSGGVCIEGVPEGWEAGQAVVLVDAEGDLDTRVAWVVERDGVRRAGLRLARMGCLYANRMRALRDLAFGEHCDRIIKEETAA